MERVMPQARALKDFELVRGDGTGQVQERDFEGYRDMLPDRWGATNIEHSCPRLDFEDSNELSHPAPSKKRRNTWKEPVERFKPNAVFRRHRSCARVRCDRLSVTILLMRFHGRLDRAH